MTLISETVRTRRHLRQSIRQLGESLGSSPGLVASNLAALQVVGKPRHSTDCAIARYLAAIVGTEQAVRTVSVSDRSVHLTLIGRRLPLRVRLPRQICKFIQAFDAGCHPELVDLSVPEPCLRPGTPC